jgi:parallel beta-helix repeat protein
MLKKLKRGVFMSRFKWVLSIMLVLLISFTASAVTLYTPTEYPVITTKTSNTEGNIKIMAYARPSDFLHFEVYVSTLSCFNPTGWNGTAWTGTPNAIEDWDGTVNTRFKISSETPINLTGLVAGTTYYVHLVAVDTYLNRSDPSNEASATAGDYQRSSTFVVAASNAAPGSKYGADYICDGVDDDVQINAALAALPEIEIEGGVSTGVLDNGIANNTCESGKPTLGGVSSDYQVTSSLSTTQKHGGANSLKIVTSTVVSADRNYILGAISTSNLNGMTAGRKYSLGVWVYVPTGSVTNLNNVATRIAQYYGGSWYSAISTSPTAFDTWQYIEVTVTIDATATGAYAVLKISEDIDNKTTYWDDLSLTNWNSITLDSSSSNTDDEYNGLKITLVSGTGAGQTRTIADYSGSLKRVITLVGEHWDVRPDDTTVYSITAKSGLVLLTEGQFTINSSILVNSYNMLQGSGSGTTLKVKNGKNIDLTVIKNYDQTNGNSNITIKNLTIHGNSANQTSGTQNGISVVYGKKVTIANVFVKLCTGYGVSFDVTKESIISESSADSCGGSGVYVWGETCTISKNIITNSSSGITVNSSQKISIMTNQCKNNQYEGIAVTESDDNVISTNICDANGQIAHNSYSNILIDNDSDNNSIQGNLCRKGTGTNKSKYGIRINNANCNGNLLTNNDCLNGGETAGISDAGAASDTGSGNRNNDGSWSVVPN